MTQAEQLAAFVVRASYDDLSEAARTQLKIRVLDALGCAIGALAADCSSGGVLDVQAASASAARAAPPQADCNREALMKISVCRRIRLQHGSSG